MDPLLVVALLFYGIGIFLGVTVYPFWVVLHKILSRRLDSLLFREPFFNKSELINYRVFPLSALKSFAYIYLIAKPAWAKKKRFAGFDEDGNLPITRPIRVACKVHFFLMLFGGVFAILFFTFITWAYFTL